MVPCCQLEEHEQTNLSSLYINQLDSLILTLEQGNIRVLICVLETPCWTSSSSKCNQLNYRPKDYNDYADIMKYLSKRYEKRIYAWEIWNEPNKTENYLRPDRCEKCNMTLQ